jgi:hypothetical protein
MTSGSAGVSASRSRGENATGLWVRTTLGAASADVLATGGLYDMSVDWRGSSDRSIRWGSVGGRSVPINSADNNHVRILKTSSICERQRIAR